MIIEGIPRTHFDVTVAHGRVVTMERVVIGYTYEGVLEGDPSLLEPSNWYEGAVRDALHHFHLRGRASLGKGVVLVTPKLRETPPYPSRPHVPYVQVLAFATSWHEAAGTALAIVWFQDSFDEPLLERFTAAVHGLDNWKSVAIPWSD